MANVALDSPIRFNVFYVGIAMSASLLLKIVHEPSIASEIRRGHRRV